MALYNHSYYNFTRAGLNTLVTGFFNTATSTRSMNWIRVPRGRKLITLTQVSFPLNSPSMLLGVYYAPRLTGAYPSTSIGYKFVGRGSLTGEGVRGRIVSGTSGDYYTWMHQYFGPWFRVTLGIEPPVAGKRFGTNTFHWTVV